MKEKIRVLALGIFLLSFAAASAQSTAADAKIAELPREKGIYHNGGHCQRRHTVLSSLTRMLHIRRSFHGAHHNTSARGRHRNRRNG